MENNDLLKNNELSDDALDDVAGGTLASDSVLAEKLVSLKAQPGITKDNVIASLQSGEFWWNLFRSDITTDNILTDDDKAYVINFISQHWDEI